MTKEEILNQYPQIEIEGINLIAIGMAVQTMQHYADQEIESLRQKNSKLVEALKLAGAELLQFVPITNVKVLDQINQALQP